jgi:quercetin dioxygenase-like cupin family protein
MRRIILCAAAAVFIASQAEAQEGIKRTPLGTIDSPPGYQSVMGYAELAPNTCGGRHSHPGSEVLEGEFMLKIDGQPDKLFKTGNSFQIPAGVVHDGCATSSGGKAFDSACYRERQAASYFPAQNSQGFCRRQNLRKAGKLQGWRILALTPAPAVPF